LALVWRAENWDLQLNSRIEIVALEGFEELVVVVELAANCTR